MTVKGHVSRIALYAVGAFGAEQTMDKAIILSKGIDFYNAFSSSLRGVVAEVGVAAVGAALTAALFAAARKYTNKE